MAGALFGTDGIRDVAGAGRLTPDTVRRVGFALARFAAGRGTPENDVAPRVLLGRDPRPSGPDLVAQLAQGLRAGGATVEDAGVLPTPALAWATAAGGFALGAMLSASHNPPEYNGIKPFLGDARKLTEAQEAVIEDLAESAPAMEGSGDVAPPEAEAWRERYIAHAIAALEAAGGLDGMALVVDLAAGAATRTAEAILKGLGAEVRALHPAGSRPINDACGSEHPQAWLAALAERPDALGIALDGDADRVLLADEEGVVLDGDDLLGILARDRAQRDGAIPGDCVVATVMSNLGLDELLGTIGVRLERTNVGDRAVAERMRATGSVFGGEPSGHVVLRRDDLGDADALIGDGVVAAVRVLQAARRLGQPLSTLRKDRTRHPQLLVNVRMAERIPLDGWPDFQAAWAQAEATLAGTGRLVIRYSGTEPLLRIMGEGRDRAAVEAAVHALAAVARSVAPA